MIGKLFTEICSEVHSRGVEGKAFTQQILQVLRLQDELT